MVFTIFCFGQGMMGIAREKSGEMKDMTQRKSFHMTEVTKGMGQSVMGTAQQAKDQTGSFFQQVVHLFIRKYFIISC